MVNGEKSNQIWSENQKSTRLTARMVKWKVVSGRDWIRDVERERAPY